MAESRSSDRLNPTDATLWAIKRDPELRTTIVGLGLLDPAPEWSALQAAVAQAIERLPRFRQRVVERPFDLGRPRWVDVAPDLTFHLRRTAAPESGDLRSVLDLCGVLAGEDFDETRPLWQIHVVEGLAEGRSALVVKVSHALTDGIGGMGLLRQFGDRPGNGHTGPKLNRTATTARSRTARSETNRSRSIASSIVSATVGAGLNPVGAVGDTIGLAESAAKLIAPAGSPLSTLMVERGANRWTGIAELPLERLRRAAHRAGGSINDGLVVIALSALADYHAELGSGARRFRVTLPVNIRPAAETIGNDSAEPAGGNQWAPARLVLEVDRTAHPFAELRKHRQVLEQAIHEPAISFGQVLAAGMLQLPAAFTTSIVGGMVKGSDIAISDVPGLSEPLTIAGSNLTRFYPFAPTGGAALNVGLVSHLGTACIGFNIDSAAISEPERLVRCFNARATDFLRRRQAPAEVRSAAPASTGRPQRPDQDDEQPGGERLSALDTAFLRMESPTTPMHMGGLFVIDGRGLRTEDDRLDIGALRRHVDRRLHRMPRLRKRLQEVPLELGRPLWVDDPRFDVAHHVQHRTLPSPGTRSQLLELCEELQMQLLDRGRPLFDLTFIDGLDQAEFGPGAVGLVERVHHAMLDGLSGVEMVALLFDGDPDAVSNESEQEPQPLTVRPPPGRRQLMVDAVADGFGEPMALARLAGRAIGSPRRTVSELGRIAETVGAILDPDHLTGGPLSRPVGGGRRLRTVTVPLEPTHQAGTGLGATINDLVLTAVTCGVRALLDHQGISVQSRFTALVPVSTRRGGMESEHGNQVAALVIELPIDHEEPTQMLAIVTDQMTHHKDRHLAEGSELLLDAADHLPPQAVDLLARAAAHQWAVDLVVTNLPGPPMPLYLRGGRVREMIPIVPLGANLPLGVAVLSYDGQLVLSFHATDEIGDELDRVAAATEGALRDLERAAEAAAGPGW